MSTRAPLLARRMIIKSPLDRFFMRLFYGPPSRYQSLGATEAKNESHRLVSFRKLALVTLALPLCGFTFCVLWSILYNFVDSTSTHCGVANYLPSVSASIGSYSPQKYIWRLSIALHSAPRYLVSFVYFKLFHASNLLFLLNCMEISSLLGLSIISSTENFVIHAGCFLIFITSSFIGIIIHLFQENLWTYFKMKMFCINTFSWVMALYFYMRHNQYCEAGVYSLFAASEYIFVISNMIFHFQAYFDFSQIDFATSHKIMIANSKFSV